MTGGAGTAPSRWRSILIIGLGAIVVIGYVGVAIAGQLRERADRATWERRIDEVSEAFADTTTDELLSARAGLAFGGESGLPAIDGTSLQGLEVHGEQATLILSSQGLATRQCMAVEFREGTFRSATQISCQGVLG